MGQEPLVVVILCAQREELEAAAAAEQSRTATESTEVRTSTKIPISHALCVSTLHRMFRGCIPNTTLL